MGSHISGQREFFFGRNGVAEVRSNADGTSDLIVNDVRYATYGQGAITANAARAMAAYKAGIGRTEWAERNIVGPYCTP